MSFSAISSSLRSSGIVYSRLTFALFLTERARYPNRHVDSVSWSLKGCGLHVMIRHVLELPPSDSDSILVSLDSRYGMCVLLRVVSALITLPSVVSD